MPLTPYCQTLTHSCLAVCFLMLTQKPINKKAEQELSLKGSQRIYPFYVVGIPAEFAKKYRGTVTIIADNKYFTGILQNAFSKHNNVTVRHEKITSTLIKEYLAKHPVICHIDDHQLGDFSHASHFVVLEKELPNDKVMLIDPWSGERKRLSFAKLEESILSLKQHIKMCPLLLHIED